VKAARGKPGVLAECLLACLPEPHSVDVQAACLILAEDLKLWRDSMTKKK
jgi:hypothetical protein